MAATNTIPAEDYQILRSGSALIDYEGAGLLRVSGPAAPEFLGNATTRVVDFLLEGQISSALVLDDEGAVVGEVLMHCEGTDYVLEVWPDQGEAVRTHLEAAAAASDGVTVDDLSDSVRVIGLEGPESFRIAEKYLSFPIASMGYSSFSQEEWNGAPLLLARTGVTGEYGYKFHIGAEQAEAFVEELLAAGAQRVGREAVDVCRMEMRFANLEKEGQGESFTPFDVGLQWMVDFGHEFTGRDALLKQWEEGLGRLPVCWSADTEQSAEDIVGSPVVLDGEEIGQVSFAVRSPQLDKVIGTARVDSSLAASGLSLSLGDGSELRTISAPFVVASSFGVAME